MKDVNRQRPPETVQRNSEDISVVVINYNNAHNLSACLDSVLEQNITPPFHFRVYTVDAGSTDESRKILSRYQQSCGVSVFQQPREKRLSPAEARNTGFLMSRGRIVVFTDSDCIVPVDWLQNILSGFNFSPNVACVFGSHFPDIGKGAGTFYRRIYTILYSRKFRYDHGVSLHHSTLKSGQPFLMLAANNFAIRRSCWNAVGNMNTVFRSPAGEDILFEIQLLRQGYEIYFDPKITVIHHHPLTLKQLLRKTYEQGRSIYFIQKHSDHFITTKHILELKAFFRNSVFILSAILVTLGLPVAMFIRLTLIAYLWTLIIASRSSELRTRMRLVMERPIIVSKAFHSTPSNTKLFLFDVCDFCVKLCRIAGYCITYISYNARKKN
ncbi:MAG: glycosyltransferase [Candidatus Uhrbacteria bacterium]|nr:glycosyltransferase [Candidatus Uhrbacteria bacterium]